LEELGQVVLAPSSYDVHSVTSNDTTVVYFATFHGQHNGDGGPVAPTKKKLTTAYVYHFTFNSNGKITKFVKIWNVGDAFKQLGWA
jgi:hypothetical protein